MKNIFLAMMCLTVLTAQAQSYVDLGLPSGTRWKTTNEKNAANAEHAFFNYKDATSRFDNCLPSKEQWEELKTECDWLWIGTGYKVTGSNGQSITLPAEGDCDCTGRVSHEGSYGGYWFSTLDNSRRPRIFNFNSDQMLMSIDDWCDGHSVRLVRDSQVGLNTLPSTLTAEGYIDLGLPSGTKWKNVNTPGVYSYKEAVSQFGSRLPSEEQWLELKKECQWSWSWTISGYIVTGPNGQSITLPATGYRYCNGSEYGVGSSGFYWSSTPNGSVSSFGLGFNTVDVGINYSEQCSPQSIRLVQN